MVRSRTEVVAMVSQTFRNLAWSAPVTLETISGV